MQRFDPLRSSKPDDLPGPVDIGWFKLSIVIGQIDRGADVIDHIKLSVQRPELIRGQTKVRSRQISRDRNQPGIKIRSLKFIRLEVRSYPFPCFFGIGSPHKAVDAGIGTLQEFPQHECSYEPGSASEKDGLRFFVRINRIAIHHEVETSLSLQVWPAGLDFLSKEFLEQGSFFLR